MVKLLAILTSCALLLECLPVRAFGGPIAYNRPNALINIGGQDLWLADPAGDNPPRALFQLDLLSGSNLLSARNPVWSRDGRYLAAVGLIAPTPGTTPIVQGTPLFGGGYSIVMFDQSGAWRRVTSLGTALDDGVYTAFSPDGTRLAYVNPGGNFAEFYVTNIDGSQRTLVGSWSIVQSEGSTGTGMDWSPAADELVIPISIPYSISGAVSGALCSLQPQQLSQLLQSQRLPVPVTALFLARPMANGLCAAEQLSFPPSSFNPYVDQSDLASLFQPVATLAEDGFPVFSHDGTKVAFVRETKTISWLSPNQMLLAIRVVDVPCSLKFHSPLCEREVVHATVPNMAVCGLSWSVEQTKLVFGLGQVYGPDVSSLACNAGLWVVNIDGTDPHALKMTPADANSPTWSWGP